MMNKTMMEILILGLSVFVQTFAAFSAFRLIRITGRRMAWGLISVALLLMAFRRGIPLYFLITTPNTISIDFINEVIGLVLSTVMAGGVILIAPLFIEFQEAKAKILRINDDLEQQVRKRTAELSKSNEQLTAEVKERVAAEEALKKAYTDLKNTQKQLIQSEKMATVGQLAAGVAHEINNPTGFVISNMDILQKYVADLNTLFLRYQQLEDLLKEEKNEKIVEVMESVLALKEEIAYDQIIDDLPKLSSETLDGMMRISRIVKDLRSFSHSDDGHLKEVNVHDVLQSALNIANNEIKYRIEVVKVYGHVPTVYCFPQLLSQVFLNLIVNAAQAIQKEGVIKIKTSSDEKDLFIEISDNGPGIPDEIQKHIFEPFFTTKPVGKGTGLGLSIAYSIIDRHKGKISVTSHPHEGTTFFITIPLRGSMNS